MNKEKLLILLTNFIMIPLTMTLLFQFGIISGLSPVCILLLTTGVSTCQIYTLITALRGDKE